MATTSRLPRQRRREQIARAALGVIGRDGVTALSASRLADEIGLTSGALFRHFASMDEILESAVLDAVARLRETFPPEDLPPLERLEALAQARVGLLRAEPGLAWLLRSEQARLCLPSTALAPLMALVQESRDYMRRALMAAQAAGQLRRDLPADLLLLVFVSTVHALIGQPGLQGTAGSSQPELAPALAGLLKLLAPVTAPAGGTTS